MNENNNKFTWNDIIRIKKNVPEHFHPGEIAVICGMEKITSKKLAIKYNTCIGKWLYTVEFKDGTSIILPEQFIENEIII